ncbi:MAG: hypothetical protein IPI11_15970 [Haliscomenobacter sp.]|nr:hypothetical protein [Haliscomenobacter sp.]
MKKCLLLLLLSSWAWSTLSGQSLGVLGMNFQAQARETGGRILANEPVKVRIGFSSYEADSAKTFYSEVHQVTTGTLGLFNVVVGQGKPAYGAYADIPWESLQIWMDIELESRQGREYVLVNRTKLQAVPYALFANTANELADENSDAGSGLEKNQSTRWLTGGNTKTDTSAHFIGTRDNQDLVIKTNNIPRVTITKEGQFQYTGGIPSGPDDVITSYPMVIQGSRQGIYIKVNGSRTGANNFLTFGDDEEFLWGAVEGQTFPELEVYWRYQLQVAVYALQSGTLVASGAAIFLKDGGLWSSLICVIATIIFSWRAPGLAVEATAVAIAAAVVIVQAGALINESVSWGDGIRRDIGVTYSTGAADYAEWLERLPVERDLEPGEIVGVKAGRVSLNTREADHLMVVSSNPFFLGNAPQPDQEPLYEKVAFLGQVPVRVFGKVEAGDFILPSGNQDGLGVAVSPGKMHLADYAEVVGVAWESGKENQVNLVQMGVGLHSNNALAPKVEEISQRVDNIIAFLEGKAPLNPGGAFSSLTPAPGRVPLGQLQNQRMPDEEFDQYIDANEEKIQSMCLALQKQLQDQGAALPDTPELREFFQDPTSRIKAMRRDSLMRLYWGQVDELIRNQR